jgi:hypothetical protein
MKLRTRKVVMTTTRRMRMRVTSRKVILTQLNKASKSQVLTSSLMAYSNSD